MANEITLKTRLLNKYNQTIADDVILGKGEINFVEVNVPLKSGETTTAILIKVGDGETAYGNLDFVAAKAADVYDWAKKARGEAIDIDYAKGTDKITVQAAIEALYEAIDALSGNSGESIADLFAQLKALGEKIDGEISRATAKEAELDGKITAEETARKAADEALDGKITKVAGDLAEEIARADAAEKKNAADIKAIADDYVTSANIANFETKANVQKVADDLSTYKTSNNTALSQKANVADVYIKNEVYTKTEIDAKDYASKSEAQGYADAKDNAISAAQTKANDAYALAETKVTAETGKRLITDAEATKLAGLENYDDSALSDAIDAIEADYLTSEDKTELNGEISRVEGIATAAKNRIDTFLDTEEIAGTVDTLHEIKTWMEGEGVNATELTEAIAAEAKLRADADTAEAKARAEADSALSDRIKAYEDVKDTYATKTALEAVSKVAEAATTVAEVDAQIDTKITALNLDTRFDNDYDAKGAADAALEAAKAYADANDTTYSAKAEGGLKLEGTAFSIADSSTGFTFILDANA